jgi:carboxypeptidase C (cathepsin A)
MADEKQTEKAAKPEVQDNLVESKHSITLNGTTINYTVTTGTMILKEETEKEGANEGETPKASFFFIAYTRDDVADPATRPITFSFNGGPGSASVWLHMGALGPRRAALTDLGDLPPPPYEIVDNDYSLLDVSDLVFIDPVGTGYSRAVVGEKDKDFHHFKKDIESVGDFIRIYTTRYTRWLSPKFVIGESYGTTRAAGLSGYLQERHGLFLNGIMLVSSILDFGTAFFTPGNDMPYIAFVPTYTATAWYHKKLDADLQKDLQSTVEQARRFALNEYAHALMQGDALPDEAREQVVQQLARFTGISPDYIRRSNLRIRDDRFVKELLRGDHRTVGRLDSRFKGIDRDAAGEVSDNDPSMSNITGPYAAAFYDYVRREVKFETDLPYEILSL